MYCLTVKIICIETLLNFALGGTLPHPLSAVPFKNPPAKKMYPSSISTFHHTRVLANPLTFDTKACFPSYSMCLSSFLSQTPTMLSPHRKQQLLSLPRKPWVMEVGIGGGRHFRCFSGRDWLAEGKREAGRRREKAPRRWSKEEKRCGIRQNDFFRQMFLYEIGCPPPPTVFIPRGGKRGESGFLVMMMTKKRGGGEPPPIFRPFFSITCFLFPLSLLWPHSLTPRGYLSPYFFSRIFNTPLFLLLFHPSELPKEKLT